MDALGKLRRDSAVHDTPKWARLAVFAALPEAEFAREILEGEGIPVAVLQDRTGIFGPGFAGPSALGVTVLVPTDRVEEARDVLADTLEAFGGDAS